MTRLVFPMLDEVLAIHAWQISSYGGAGGVRDLALLMSALALPQATFDGRDLHATIEEKAAAYLFHIAQNPPFVDGNKRVALATALVFLWLNERVIGATEDDVVDVTLGVASGHRSKAEVAVFFQKHAQKHAKGRG